MQPIVGRRFECRSCPLGPGSSLCEQCHRGFLKGTVEHPTPDGSFVISNLVHHQFRSFEGQPAARSGSWSRVTAKDRVAPPSVPNGFVLRPEFRTGADSFFGSYAFLIADESKGAPVLLTSLHVMDELIKHHGVDCSPENDSYDGRALPRLVTTVVLYDVFAASWPLAKLGSASAMLILPDARVGDEEPRSDRDIAAFVASPGSNWSPRTLASRALRVADPVWLVVAPRPGSPERVVPAIVVEQNDETMIFRYSADRPPPRNSSGAPLVDCLGEVVGINAGGGRVDGVYYGHATPAHSIRRHLGGARNQPHGLGLVAGNERSP